MASPHGGFTGRNIQGERRGNLTEIIEAEAAAELVASLSRQAKLMMEAEMELELMEEVELTGCHLVLFPGGGQAASPPAEVVALLLQLL